MNLYLIKLKNNKEYYVVADDSEQALNKLDDYFQEYVCCIDEINVKKEWLEIKNIANNWFDKRIGIFE